MNGKFKVTLTALGSVFLLATVMLAAQDARFPHRLIRGRLSGCAGWWRPLSPR